MTLINLLKSRFNFQIDVKTTLTDFAMSIFAFHSHMIIYKKKCVYLACLNWFCLQSCRTSSKDELLMTSVHLWNTSDKFIFWISEYIQQDARICSNTRSGNSWIWKGYPYHDETYFQMQRNFEIFHEIHSMV